MRAARLHRRIPGGRSRSAEARIRLPRRALGPLPARRHLVPPRGSHRRGPHAAAAAPGEPRRLGHDDRAERVQRGRLLQRELHGQRALVPQGLPPAARVRGIQVGAALRVRQLPRAGVAERQADRLARRRLPAVRAAREERAPPRREPPRRARRQPPPEVRHPAAVPARVGRVRGRMVELQRHPARGLPAARRPVRLRAGGVPAEPALPHVRRHGQGAGDRRERQHQGRAGAHQRQLRGQEPALPRAPRAGPRRAPLPRPRADPQPAPVEPRAPDALHRPPAAAHIQRAHRAEAPRPHRRPHPPREPPRAHPAELPRREPARREHARGLAQPRARR